MSQADSKLRSSWRLAGNRRFFLLCFLLFISSCLLSFWLSFPADVLQRRLVREATQQTGLEMQGANAAMLFPFGLRLDLRIYPAQPELAPIELKEMQISPAWLTLLSASPAVDLYGQLANGLFDMRADRVGKVDLNLSNVELASLQKADSPYRLQGELSGKLSGDQLSAAMSGRGEFYFQIPNAVLRGFELFDLPAELALGQLKVAGKFNQRRLSIEKISLNGGVLEVSGGGTLLIGETRERTRLNLNIRLFPTQATPDSLRDLLSLTGVKPTADGSYLLRVGGSLAKPQLR